MDMSYKNRPVSERGNALVITLVVVAVFAAGFVGYMLGQKNTLEQGISADQIIAASGQAGGADSKADNPVIARVGGEDIRRKDVLELVNAMPPQMRQVPLPQLYPMALEQLISNKVVDSKAAQAGLEKDKEVQKQLALAQKQIIRARFLETVVESKIDDARVKEEYDTYLEKFPDIEEIKAAHILVEDEKTAKDIIQKLDKGADFAALAKEYSTDGSAENGGELGYFAENEVVPEFSSAAFSAKVGTYIKTPVKSDFGYHIIRVDEKRKRPPATFAQIESFLKQDLQRKVFDEVMQEWKSAVQIERFDINGNPIAPADQEPSAGGDEDMLDETSFVEDDYDTSIPAYSDAVEAIDSEAQIAQDAASQAPEAGAAQVEETIDSQVSATGEESSIVDSAEDGDVSSPSAIDGTAETETTE